MSGSIAKKRSWWRRGKLNCREVGASLQLFLDGEVDADFAQGIEAHLAACRDCGLEAETFEAISHALSRSGERLDDDAIERLRQFGEGLQQD